MKYFTCWKLCVCTYKKYIMSTHFIFLTLRSSLSAHRKLFTVPRTSHTISCSGLLHIIFSSVLPQHHFAFPYSFFRTWFLLPSKDGFLWPMSELGLFSCEVYLLVSSMMLGAHIPQWLIHQLCVPKCSHTVGPWGFFLNRGINLCFCNPHQGNLGYTSCYIFSPWLANFSEMEPKSIWYKMAGTWRTEMTFSLLFSIINFSWAIVKLHLWQTQKHYLNYQFASDLETGIRSSLIH